MSLSNWCSWFPCLLARFQSCVDGHECVKQTQSGDAIFQRWFPSVWKEKNNMLHLSGQRSVSLKVPIGHPSAAKMLNITGARAGTRSITTTSLDRLPVMAS